MIKRIQTTFLFRLFLIAGLTLQIVWCGLVWSRMIFQPATSRPADFSIFYTAGRIADSGHYNLIYDIPAQIKIQEVLLDQPLQDSQLLPFNHPPFFVPILQIISTQDYMASYWRWVFIMFCFVVGTILLIDRLLRSMNWDIGSRWIFIISTLLFYPIFASLLKGQDSAILLFGAVLWLYGLIMKKDIPAGIGLALTLIRPQVALILAVPFLFNRRKIWWWFCGGAALLGLYSYLLVGPEGVRDFITLLGISAKGEGYGMIQKAMFNFTGMAFRLFKHANPDVVHMLAWGLFLAAIIGLSIWWKVSAEIDYRHIVLVSTLSVFAAPHLNYHDLVMLLVPVLALAMIGVRTGRLRLQLAALLPMLASVLFLIADWADPIRYTMPYLIMAALLLLTWLYETR